MVKQDLGKELFHVISTNCPIDPEKPFQIIDCSVEDKIVENNILGYREPETGRFIRGALEASNGGTVVFSNVDGLSDDFQRDFTKF